MFNHLKPPRGHRRDDDHDEYSPFAESPETSRNRVVGQAVNDGAARVRQTREPGQTSYFDRRAQDEDEEGEDEDNEDEIDTPLLPIFSAAHLDRLPLYNITHAIRALVVQRCETTLSWDQLRSPQVSQFLVKPIQLQIRTNHFNRATLCALIANCLQFQKESQMTPGNLGVLRTRALMSELLAMRLVKEYTVRELIDALSYDFDPLRGMASNNQGGVKWDSSTYGDGRIRKVGRVSTIEIAIKAQAKRFLAHPLVVQHLEAIWAGTIVFYSEADSLHRKPKAASDVQSQPRGRSGYGTMNENHTPAALPADSIISRKAQNTRAIKRPPEMDVTRRTVTLYNPREASLFKLSRLRVPRYRQLFSTVSFATMLGLYIAVLVDRSLYITPLEVLFWIWSIGYMLDEIIGFTEQGFGLYILSFWNAFDLGILLLFVVYYALRLYGIVLAEEGKHRIASMSYDVLASTAVLLFPRLFSVLDHYRYFSQLLIAFRMMAQDLLAILVLIVISCSGFFVAFTLSFSDEATDGGAVAYALFQLLMGFTPAAWEKWAGYNILGKIIMTMFLIICHFLIVTILITVLTNSFMAIVQNASEEHQFLFAINTLSMVKSDTLFSYIPPTNVMGWLLSPLRLVLPFRQYIKLNRTVIKVTHFPVLWTICVYERLVLAKSAYEPTDLVQRHNPAQRKPLAFSLNKAPAVFSPGQHRLREPSVMSFHKDRALDEVFRKPFRGSTVRTTAVDMDIDRGTSTNVVDKWMQQADDQGGASPPMDQPRSVVERLEHRRLGMKRAATGERFARQYRDSSRGGRSVASDPDLFSNTVSRRPKRIDEEDEPVPFAFTSPAPQETDADGDAETNDESDSGAPDLGESALSMLSKENRTPAEDTGSDDEFFHTPTASKSPINRMSNAARARLSHHPSYDATIPQSRRSHGRNASSGTILFAPQPELSTSQQRLLRTNTRRNSGANTPAKVNKPKSTVNETPKRPGLARLKTAPNAAAAGMSWINLKQIQRQPSFTARALDLASEIGDNKWTHGGFDVGGISGMPASFSEQMMREREFERQREAERRRSEEEEKGMVNRIMLARMHTLEEGFREVLREIKDMSHAAGSSRRDSELEVPSKSKQRQDMTVSISSSISGAPSKTPIGRISGNSKLKKTQKKSERRMQSLDAEDGAAAPGPAGSPDTVTGSGGDPPANEDAERPKTALKM
ncbi:hypothetical protein AMS68_004062 [Peltaster fructicola]|uniref:Uncharacterized protein n=1 Tax=Peltaster fructicola TaxID=286661 RepID=A0A6H0XV61_9PEZI|nr:hypothetical protein AMS68_004062 [Peltaster fructicola]